MKVKTNWLDGQNYAGLKNGSFDKSGSDVKNKPSRPDNYPNFYIVKKNTNATESFSVLLLDEFNGTRIPDSRDTSKTSFAEKTEKEAFHGRKNSVSVVSEKDLKAVNFLNGYWA